MTPEKLAVAICMQARRPVFVWGGPGTTKTASLRALAEVLGMDLWTVILSIRGPWDQGGIPVIRPDESVWLAPPSWAKELADSGSGCVFLDELNVAPATTQNSALRVVAEKHAGDLQLPDATSFVAAGNPPSTNAGAYDLTAAMANRYVHVEWPTDVEGYVAGMKSGWAPPVVPRISPDWMIHVPAKQWLVGDFIERRPHLLYQRPDDRGEAGKAWPSHRSWDNVAHVLAAADTAGYDLRTEVGGVLVSGCVGTAACHEFRSWFINLDLPDPEAYLRNTDTPMPDRQDQLYATLDAIVVAALSMRKAPADQLARFYAAWRVIGRLAKGGKKDLCLPPAMTLLGILGTEGREALQPVAKQWPQEIELFDDILKQAGIDLSMKDRL